MAKWYTTVNKELKKNIITKGGEVLDVPRIPTGSLSLDVETGGGFPVGKMITVAGEYSDGKTAIVLKVVAEFQKKWPNKEVVWIDAEGAWDNTWSKALGVDVDGNILIVRPEYSEQAFDIAIKAVMNDVGLIVIDSIAALSPRFEAEADMETNTVALQSRLNKKFMRKMQNIQNDEGDDIPPTAIFINQLMVNISAQGQHKPTVETGGKSLEYYPSLKIKLRRGKLYPESKSVNDEGVEPKAQSIRFFTEKNKTAPPHRRGHFWFYFDSLDEHRTKGSYDRLEEVIRYALKYGIVQKRASIYDVPDPVTGEVKSLKGSNALAEYIRENEDVWHSIEEKVMEVVNSGEGARTISENEEREKSAEQRETVRVLEGT